MASATRQTTTRIISRRGNIVAVDFRTTEPDPPFPAAPGLRDDHPAVLQPDDDLLRVALYPRGRRIAA